MRTSQPLACSHAWERAHTCTHALHPSASHHHHHHHTDTTNQSINQPHLSQAKTMSFNLAADVGAFHTTCVEKEQELAAARRRTAEARAAVEKGEVSERKRGDGRPCVGKGGMDSLTHSPLLPIYHARAWSASGRIRRTSSGRRSSLSLPNWTTWRSTSTGSRCVDWDRRDGVLN